MGLDRNLRPSRWLLVVAISVQSLYFRRMFWHDVACFFGGVFLANFAPHFVAGVSGRPFPSPFATPPFRGLSTPVVNVAWGLFNLAVAYGLLVLVGSVEPKNLSKVSIAAAGFGLASLGIARSMGRLHGGST